MLDSCNLVSVLARASFTFDMSEFSCAVAVYFSSFSEISARRSASKFNFLHKNKISFPFKQI